MECRSVGYYVNVLSLGALMWIAEVSRNGAVHLHDYMLVCSGLLTGGVRPVLSPC